jgi:hypothetical protein
MEYHSDLGRRSVPSKVKFEVRGDFARVLYSTHSTRKAAERAARALAKKWGYSHIGSEPVVRVVGGE